MDGTCSAHEVVRTAYKMWLESLTERNTRKPRCKWEGKITIDFIIIGYGGVDWIHLAKDRDR
jgi:hypothetical protein